MKAICWGVGSALYLYFGLEPTAWIFYEASHFLNIAWLYWGYSLFRGADFALNLYGYSLLVALLGGSLVAVLVHLRARRKIRGNAV